MTVENQFPYQSLTANGEETSFTLGFYVDDKNHFEVKKNDQAVTKNDYSYNSSSNTIVFNTAPKQGDLIEVQRSTTTDRAINYSTYNNSFRPEVLNKDIDRVWLKLQELGVTDQLQKLYFQTLHNQQQQYIQQKDAELKTNINEVKSYSDLQNNALKIELKKLIEAHDLEINDLDTAVLRIKEHISSLETSSILGTKMYPSISVGLANTKNEDFFSVISSNNENYIELYKKENGAAVNQNKAYLSLLGIKSELSKSIVKTEDYASVEVNEKLLSDVYQNLAQAKVDYPFVTDLNASLGWAVLQKQFNSLDTTKTAKKIISGSYYVNRTLNYNAKSSVEWDLKLILDGGVAGQYAIVFDNIDESKHVGKIQLSCKTTDPYETPNWSIRSWWEGLLFKRVTTTDFTSLVISGKLKGQLVNVVGVVNNGNYVKFGIITGSCGSKYNDWVCNITAKINNGTANNATQATVLTLDQTLPTAVAGHIIRIGEEYHHISAVSDQTITVDTWVNPTATTLSVIYGGIVRSNGDNSNNINFKAIRGFRSACTYSSSTQMGVGVNSFGAEYNEIGIVTGHGNTTNASVGIHVIELWYSEHNAIDIYDTRTIGYFVPSLRVKAQVGLGTSNWTSKVFKAAPKDENFIRNERSSEIIVEVDGFTRKSTVSKSTGLSSDIAYVYVGEREDISFKNDIQTIQLDCNSKQITNFGKNSLTIKQVGSGNNGGVKRTILQCYIPYTFRYPSEANGRYLYLPETSKPRELLIEVTGNIIDVYEVNNDKPISLTDLSTNKGTGIFKYQLSASNLGNNPPTTGGVIKSTAYNTDIYLYEAIEELFAFNSATNVLERKIRAKRGSTFSDWSDIPTQQLSSVTPLLTTATLPEVIAAFNNLIADMKAKKYMA